MGVHITAVRSMTMDKWAEEHIARMMAGGNGAFIAYVQEVYANEVDVVPSEDETFKKYSSPRITYYR
jgi:hypothetical protein